MIDVIKYQVATMTPKTKKIICTYNGFGEGKKYWSIEMAGYASTLHSCLINSLLYRLRGILPKDEQLIHSKLYFQVTDQGGLDVPHRNNVVLDVPNARSFYIQSYNEGIILFLYDTHIVEVKKVWIPHGCGVIMCGNCTMGGYTSSKGSITLRGTLIPNKLDRNNERV